MVRELNELVFREITGWDDAALAGIIRRSLEAHGLDIPGTAYFDPGLDHLSRFYLEKPAQRYYCVLSDRNGNVLGGVGVADLEAREDCCELQKLYLEPSARGQGLGARLVFFIENKARELGYKAIYLETHDDLPAAVRLYASCGYREIRKPEGVVHSAMNRFFIKEL